MITTREHVLRKFNLDPNDPYLGKMPLEVQRFNRADLAMLFAELGFKVGAEIGVEQGEYAEVLFKANPGLTLFCIDAWKSYSGYRDHKSQDKLDRFLNTAAARLSRYNARMICEFSMEAVKRIEPGSLDFVYIDANHQFEYVVNDIIEWSKRVRSGGIVSGHDYIRSGTNYPVHVVEAVTAYTSANQIRPWFVLGSRSTEEVERDHPRSWMWIKP